MEHIPALVYITRTWTCQTFDIDMNCGSRSPMNIHLGLWCPGYWEAEEVEVAGWGADQELASGGEREVITGTRSIPSLGTVIISTHSPALPMWPQTH